MDGVELRKGFGHAAVHVSIHGGARRVATRGDGEAIGGAAAATLPKTVPFSTHTHVYNTRPPRMSIAFVTVTRFGDGRPRSL